VVQDTGEAFVRVPLGLVALNWLRLYVPLVRESLPQNLEAFGWMHVPTHLWRAMRRNAVWIEPTLITEWGRLIREYGRSQGRHIAEEKIIASMRWSDPERDVLQVRKIALSLVGSRDIRCIWTDSLLNTSTLDIDHMFPWAAWPCGDLWNLLPTDRRVNQRLKRNRLPSAAVLSRAEGRIIDWWQQAYLVLPGSARQPAHVLDMRTKRCFRVCDIATHPPAP
jgi:hypothetical protein